MRSTLTDRSRPERQHYDCPPWRGTSFVFLAGLHRSGTTLLARLLAAHPEISGFSETGVPADEGQHLQSVYPAAKDYGGPGRFGFAPESHLTEASPLVSEESARKLFEEWSPHWDLSRPLLLEKSPPNLLKTRFLQALFPGSAFVVIVRHPIPVSIPTARWRGTRRYDRMFEHWLRCHALFEADREHLGAGARPHVRAARPRPGRRAARDLRVPRARADPAERARRGRSEREVLRQWQELKRDLRMRAYLDLVSLRYERRVRRYGYSLLSP